MEKHSKGTWLNTRGRIDRRSSAGLVCMQMRSKKEMMLETEREFLGDYYDILSKLAKFGITRNPAISYLAVNYPPRPLARSIESWYKEFYEKISDTINSFNSKNRSLNIYLHIPFCSRLCTFCHYNLTTRFDENTIREYVSDLSEEIRIFSKQLVQFPETVKLFLGGGSPSQLSTRQIRLLYRQVEESFKSKIVESTIEIHPEMARKYADLNQYFNELEDIGIARISIGLQSSNDDILKRCNRGHTALDAQRVMEVLKDFAFITNIDTLIELPGQTLGTFFDTLEFAYCYIPTMITVYPLHLKPGSYDYVRFTREKDDFPDWKLTAKLMILADKLAGGFGYYNDLVNWYKRPGAESEKDTELSSRWLDEQNAVIGFGSGAYSRIIFNYSNILYWNDYSLESYRELVRNQKIGANRFIQMDVNESVRQQLILRMKSSNLRRDHYEKLCSLMESETLKEVEHFVKELENIGLVTEDSDRIQLTKVGRVLSEEIAACFASDSVLNKLKEIGDPSEIRRSFFPDAKLSLRFKEFLRSLRVGDR